MRPPHVRQRVIFALDPAAIQTALRRLLGQRPAASQ